MSRQILPAILLSFCALVCLVVLLSGLWTVLAFAFPQKRQPSAPQQDRAPILFRRTTILLVVWILLLTVLSLAGFFSDFSRLPPRIALALLIPLPVVLVVAFSTTGKRLLGYIPPHWLIYLQSFRIVVEIALWICVLDRLLPIQMSFEGRNFDILSGLLALPVAYYCFVKKTWPVAIAMLYNIAGLLLLANIVAVAILSAPTPIRAFHNQPDSSLVAQFPFIFLPGLLVPLAYTLHIFSICQIILTRQSRR